jgi:hypothetical protein
MGIWFGIRERYYREFGCLPGEDPEADNESEDTEELQEEGCDSE